ncbi:MAG: hypothetical protein V3S41_05950 [Spirochaetia bacterium]
MNQRVVGLILFIVMTAAGAFGQTTGLPRANVPPAEETMGDASPGEIPPGDPPKWARNLRRAEIVAIGSFPLTLLAARLTYSLLRFAVRSIQAGGIDVIYAPWFLAPPGSPELEFAEKLGIVAGATGLSSLIALIDYRRGRNEDDPEQ